MKEQKITELDVRQLPTWERHPRILAAFDALEIGGELRIISDHEPRPLRNEFERLHSRHYVWLQQKLGVDHWEVLLRRAAAPASDYWRDFLRRCAVFADVSSETLSSLESAVVEKLLARNDPVAEQDVDWDGFGVVEHGTLAAVVGSPLGREHLLFEILPGEAFGEIATVDGGSTPARYVVTSQSARLLCIPKSVMRLAIRNDPALARALNAVCAQHMRLIIERFVAQTSLSTLARVAAALLPHAAPQPGLSRVLPSFQMTQSELATAAGTVKEVVSRALAELEEAAAIERSGGHIVKIDREKLSAYAGCL